MKKRVPDKFWFPWWPDKWIFGSVRIECTPAERGIWVDLLSLASKDDGHIRANEETPYPLQQLSGMLIIPEDELKKAIEKFIKNKKLIKMKSGTLYVAKWDKYQFSERHKSRLEGEMTDEIEWDDSDRPTYVINDRIRSSVYSALKKKRDGGLWEKLLGYTRKNLVNHIENQFSNGMNWENYGEWHLDHKIPLCESKYRSFSEVEEIRKFWSFDNLEPLWKEENLRKSGKMSQNRDVVSQDEDAILNNNKLDNNKLDNNKLDNKKGDIDIEFDEFWKFYHTIGNKGDDAGDKQEAKKAYKTLRKKEPKKNIVKATNGYSDFLKYKELKEGFSQKKMYGSTFLRSKRWERFLTFKFTPSL